MSLYLLYTIFCTELVLQTCVFYYFAAAVVVFVTVTSIIFTIITMNYEYCYHYKYLYYFTSITMNITIIVTMKIIIYTISALNMFRGIVLDVLSEMRPWIRSLSLSLSLQRCAPGSACTRTAHIHQPRRSA